MTRWRQADTEFYKSQQEYRALLSANEELDRDISALQEEKKSKEKSLEKYRPAIGCLGVITGILFSTFFFAMLFASMG